MANRGSWVLECLYPQTASLLFKCTERAIDMQKLIQVDELFKSGRIHPFRVTAVRSLNLRMGKTRESMASERGTVSRIIVVGNECSFYPDLDNTRFSVVIHQRSRGVFASERVQRSIRHCQQLEAEVN